MRPRSILARLIVYVLLLTGAAVFLFPFLWLVCTSLKPIEQTMSMPPTWLPRAYYATVNGERVEVTRDYPVPDRPGYWHVTERSPANGSSRATQSIWWVLGRGRPPGCPNSNDSARPAACSRAVYGVAPYLANEVPHEPASGVVSASEIEIRIQPRWDNYRTALATMGGRSANEAQGSATGIGLDAQVSFFTFLGNTLLVCVLGVSGAVLSNAIIAYGFAKIRWRGRDTLFALTLATMMVPFPVLMVPLYGVFKGLGWIGSLKPLWVPAFFGSAFNIFLMRQFFRTIPEELSEAARIDGCSEWSIFWRIILPLSKPVLAVVALFHFLWAWNDFMGPLLYLTRKHTFTLALALQNYQSQGGGVQWHYLMAATIVVIIPIVILFFFTQKTFIKGIATTGLKG
jgi:multiple sugar transport system permease protein